MTEPDRTGTDKGHHHAANWLSGGGEMGRLIRAFDWSATPLGPVESWPQSLRSAVSILLPSRAQILLLWGPHLIAIYNDAYRPVLGGKHPRALGLPVREMWREVWQSTLKELFEGVLRTGEAFWASDHPFALERYGFPEETFFDVSYDPVRDESGDVGGLFCIVSETTARVVNDRRLRTLRELSMAANGEARSVEEACRAAAQILSSNQHDLSFALIYLLDEAGQRARLAGASGLEPGSVAAPLTVDLADEAGWPFATVLKSNTGWTTNDLPERFGPLPGGAWPESTHTAVVLPTGTARSRGFLVVGVSPRRPLDELYRAFLELLAHHVATIIASARAYEDEKHRAEALAELDRAKTAFFSNVSHEFRTPLTLILGPVEDVLATTTANPEEQHHTLEIAHRNALRLKKLVNTLLDFSRIEAGRIQASYEPADLAEITAELASNFRSACERAGLELRVNCPPLPEPVFVDLDMWEKIVLNLVSNAFKFTFEGSIDVSLQGRDGRAELTVRDTGSGIPANEMPRLFERFHRIEGAQGRTQEGSGIGLALVRELARLHGGEVAAESELGRGTAFTVSIPLGKDHLPAERVNAARDMATTSVGAASFVEEALRWLPDTGKMEPLGLADAAVARMPEGADRARILIADDNADMRRYLQRLLEGQYSVATVADGSAALATARATLPDLVLADMMMPGLDGFALMRELRRDPATREIPIIILSARAGEEARIEGITAGADDYMTKPFNARELIARVHGQLQLAAVRREARDSLRRDVHAREQAQQRVMARDLVTRVLADSHTLDEAAPRILGAVCEHLGWHAGGLWCVDERENVLRCVDMYHRSDISIPRFEADSRNRTFARGAGLPGRVWSQNRPLWIPNVVEDDNFPRASSARDEGLHGAIAFPIELDGVVLGVAEFFSRRIREPEPELLDMLAAVGSQVGQFIERVRAEQNVARERERLAVALRTGQMGAYEWCPGEETVWWSPETYLLFGVDPETFVPSARTINDIVHPDDREELQRKIAECIAQRQMFQHEYRIVRADGEVRWLASISQVGVDAPGRGERVTGVAMDITERRETERRKDEFLAMLSHELRNPLAPMRNAVHILQTAELSSTDVQTARAVIGRQLDQMTRLVDDLLDMSRITRGKIELRRSPVSLRTVVTDAVEAVRPFVEQSGHTFSVELPDENITLDGDAMRLSQVLLNLMNNAAKYTEPGGQIDLRATRDGDHVVISVRDNGMGIPAHMIAHIFDMFAQAERTIDRAQGGLGIGLTLVQRLVTMHGGTVEAHSDGPGKGSLFVVRLPCTVGAPEVVPAADVGVERPKTAAPRRILVVDDNQDAADSMAMFLDMMGHEVRTAHDGLAAVEAAAAFEPAIVLLDIGLPKLNGYEVARQIRARFGTSVKLIALTGWGQEEDRRRSRDAGFDAHLTKPVEFNALNALLAGGNGTNETLPSITPDSIPPAQNARDANAAH